MCLHLKSKGWRSTGDLCMGDNGSLCTSLRQPGALVYDFSQMTGAGGSPKHMEGTGLATAAACAQGELRRRRHLRSFWGRNWRRLGPLFRVFTFLGPAKELIDRTSLEKSHTSIKYLTGPPKPAQVTCLCQGLLKSVHLSRCPNLQPEKEEGI